MKKILFICILFYNFSLYAQNIDNVIASKEMMGPPPPPGPGDDNGQP